MTSIVKTRELDIAYLQLTDTGVCIVEYKPGTVLDEDMARRILKEQVAFAGSMAPVLADLHQVKSFTKGARDFFASSRDNIQASSYVALLIDSPIGRVIANFFLGLNRATVPTRMFTDRDKALAWLEKQSGRFDVA